VSAVRRDTWSNPARKTPKKLRQVGVCGASRNLRDGIRAARFDGFTFVARQRNRLLQAFRSIFRTASPNDSGPGSVGMCAGVAENRQG
jgi:hypothetical protein